MMNCKKSGSSLGVVKSAAATALIAAAAMLSGCGTTIAIGVGHELNGSTIRENEISCFGQAIGTCDVRQASNDGPVGMIEIESPSWKGFSVEYQHVSIIERGELEDPLDMVALKYSFQVGEKRWKD